MKASKYFQFSYLLLLAIYLPFHHFVVNYLGVSWGEFLLLVALNVVGAAALMAACWLGTKNGYLSALLTFPLMLFFLLFGALQDQLVRLITLTALHYIFLIVALAITLTVVTKAVKKKPKIGIRLSWLFNLIVISWILIELFTLGNTYKIVQTNKHHPDFRPSVTSWSPDIYLLIADEYPREDALKTVFDFDNREFITDLKKRGFDLIDSIKSNYDITSFSVASTFNLNYLTLKETPPTNSDYSLVSWKIKTSPLWNFLNSQGYKITNNSVFNINGQTPIKNSYIRDYKAEYFRRTLPGRLYNDLGLKPEENDMTDYEYNQQTISRLLQFKDGGYKNFLYGHLLMPHFPRFQDSAGNLYPKEKWLASESFIPYLLYTNKMLLSIIDHLQRLPGEKIILVLSDHGLRKGSAPSDSFFKNFSAVYSTQPFALPENLNNINLMRIILNISFNQHLPLMEDKQFHLLSSDPTNSISKK